MISTLTGTCFSTHTRSLFETYQRPHSAPYPSNTSLLSLFAAQALPVALKLNNTRASIPAFFITNSGSQRFDVYSGAFTKNDQLTASPFADSFLYIANVTSGVAQKVFATLNSAGSDNKKRSMEWEEAYKRGEVDFVYREWLREMDRREGAVEKRAAGNLTLGYVTSDVGFPSFHHLCMFC